LTEVLAADLDDRLAAEHRRAREQVVRDRAEGVQVGAGVDRLGRDDGLGGHVLRRAGQRERAGELDVSIDLELLHEAEVEQLHDVALAALRAEHDVRRLDVAVDEADRVRFGQRSARHRQDADDARGRLCSADRDDALERRAVEELHRVLEDAVVRSAVVEDRDRVRVREARRQLHLSLEAEEARLAGVIRAEELERRRSPHHSVASAVDLAHAAFADLPLDHVLAELARVPGSRCRP
jgi:hypothetical protein